MIKKTFSISMLIIATILFTACSAKPGTNNITSYQSEQSSWQKSQSEKEFRSLDRELQ